MQINSSHENKKLSGILTQQEDRRRTFMGIHSLSLVVVRREIE